MSIQAKGINLEFDGNNLFNSNIDIELSHDNKILLYGPSGSGKTRIFNMLSYLQKPTKGTVIWDTEMQETIQKANKERYKYISMIYSTFYFLESLNIEENILMPAQFANVDKTIMQQRLEMLYDAFVFEEENKKLTLKNFRNRDIASLSNGQKELVSIARAMMLDSKIIFADELLRSFNSSAESIIWDKFINLLDESKKGLFMITHKNHLRNAKGIDRVYMIKNQNLILELDYKNDTCQYCGSIVN